MRAERPWARFKPNLFTDRALLRAVEADSIDELWQRLRRRPFFISADDRAAFVRGFLETYPDARADVVPVAEAALDHQFDLLGSGPRSLGSALPWHADFKTGREWPLQYASTIQYLELDRPSDVKVPWELSRCQHFTALGQAYWLTGDDRYADEFVAEVDDWIARNPLAYGVNWAVAMDVALRAASWIWGFYFFADAPACSAPGFRGRLLRSLYLHGEYIASHLERGEVNGNHYLCNGVGLVFLGVLFGGTEPGRRWLDLGRAIVVDEIARQTTADGVDFEQSTAYHRLVLEGFATSYLLLRAAGERIPDGAWERLERMYEFVEAYTKPDGQAPLIGDADDGRIQKLGSQLLNDHRYLLSTGAVIFGRADFKRAAGRFWAESFWMLGPSGAAEFARLAGDVPAATSRAFRDGGVFVLRTSGAHVIVDCAEVGMNGRGGHGHNDILSFELWLDGVNWVTDCGSYVYTASREWRNLFRSTQFHNTVQVDGEEVNRFIGPDVLWQLHYDAIPTPATITCGRDADRFTGGHRGYARLAQPVTISRDIALHHGESKVSLVDSLDGAGSHDIVSRFHLASSVTATRDGDVVRLSCRGRELSFRMEDRPGFSIVLEPGWVSPSYGVKLPTTVVVCSGRATMPLTLSYSFVSS